MDGSRRPEMNRMWTLVALLLLVACGAAPTEGPPPRPPATSGAPLTDTSAATAPPAQQPTALAATEPPLSLTPEPPTPTIAAEVAVDGALITIRARGEVGLPDSMVVALRGIPGVVTVEPVLAIAAQPYPIFGVEPGAPLRVFNESGNRVGAILRGQAFTAEDAGQPVAIVGSQVVVEAYRVAPGESMPGMVHGFQAGQSFRLPDVDAPVRVVGIHSTGDQSLDATVLMPLTTARALYGIEGVTHVFVTTAESADVVEVKAAIEALLRGGP